MEEALQPLCHEKHAGFCFKDSAQIEESAPPSNSNWMILGFLSKWLNWVEIKAQVELAGPMIFVNLVQFLLQVISVMFVGHLGELALASASLAASFANVTGLSVLVGMASALETLCGQSYGAKQYQSLSLHAQRAVLILISTSLPLTLIWVMMGKILLLLGQDPDIARKGGEYACWLIPNLYAYATLQPVLKFLQAQSILAPMVAGSLITLCFHIVLSWFMIYKTHLGFRGAALSTSFSNWINVALLLLYVRYSKRCEKTRTPLLWDALHGWRTFFMLAIPSTAMICLEWSSYEILVLLSGLLPNPQLSTSVLSICLNSCSLAFMIPLGLSAAVSTRVSNELGAGRPQAARHAVHISVGLALVESLVVGAIFFFIQDVWGWVYSNDKEVVAHVATVMPLIAVSTVGDSLQAVLSGVARGCGWQKLGAYANLGSYYVVGLPAACLFGFVLHLQGKGLWMGLMCGTFIQVFTLSSITLALDWQRHWKLASGGLLHAKMLFTGSEVTCAGILTCPCLSTASPKQWNHVSESCISHNLRSALTSRIHISNQLAVFNGPIHVQGLVQTFPCPSDGQKRAWS